MMRLAKKNYGTTKLTTKGKKELLCKSQSKIYCRQHIEAIFLIKVNQVKTLH